MMERDPDYADEVLGEPPELIGPDRYALALYDQLRAATPPDLGVSPASYLSLYERLYGPVEAEPLLERLAAMNIEHARAVAERQSSARGGRERPPSDRAPVLNRPRE